MSLKSKKLFVDVRTYARTNIWDRLYSVDSVEESTQTLDKSMIYNLTMFLLIFNLKRSAKASFSSEMTKLEEYRYIIPHYMDSNLLQPI